MLATKVEPLKVNFKTLEQFKRFVGCGAQELSMYEDLEAKLIEENAESPFFGIYYGGLLIARMSLYVKRDDTHSLPTKGRYLELRKLEVLPEYKKRGYGTELVQFAKQYNLPIVTIARVQSHNFWVKQGFAKMDEENDTYYWIP